MKAIVIAETNWNELDLLRRLRKQLDDFELLMIAPSDHTLYYEANSAIKAVKDNPQVPVFVVVTDPMFAAIISAKLALVRESFQVMVWEEERFRVLKVP